MRKYLIAGLGLVLSGITAACAGNDTATAPATQAANPLTTRSVGVIDHKRWAQLLAFSPEGSILASCGGDVTLADARSGRVVRTLELPGYSANSMAFSADGTLLALGTNQGEVELLDAQSLELQRPLSVCRWSIYAVAMSPDKNTLASCAGDGTVQLWNYQTGRQLRTVGEKGERMASIVFSPDAKLVVTLTRYGRADVWEVATGRKIDMLPGQGGDERAGVRFCPDGKTVVVNEPGKLRFWKPASGKPPRTVEPPDSFNPRILLEKRVDRSKPESVLRFVGQTAISADCSVAAIVNEDGTIAIWNLQSRDVLQVVAGSRTANLMGGGLDAMVFSPDGRYLATGNRTGKVEIWPVSGQPRTAPPTPPATRAVGPTHVAFGPEIDRVVTDFDSHAKDAFIDLDSGQLLTPPGTTMGFAPLGQLGRAWEPALGKWIAESPVDAGVEVGKYPDGTIRARLVGIHLKAALVSQDDWGKLSPADVRSMFRKPHTQPTSAEDSPTKDRTFQVVRPGDIVAFQTAQGGIGLLQVLAWTEKPSGMRIRYKMRPTSQPATQPASPPATTP